MHTLYYSPGACSLAPHILLNELDLPHKLVRLPTGEEKHKQSSYLAINPMGKLPTLISGDGETLTEVPAILSFLATTIADANVVPSRSDERAQLDSLLAFIASEVHPAYAMWVRPDRVFPQANQAVLDAVAERGKSRFDQLLTHLERRFVGPYALGEQLSIADPYLFVMVCWARFASISLEERPKLTKFFATMAIRPSVVATLRAESLIDDSGRPTPPTKV